MKTTKYAVFLLALLLSTTALPQVAAGQDAPIRAYKHLGGPTGLHEVLREEKHGAYVELKSFQTGDTLTVWVEHVTPQKPPSTRSPEFADKVVWCHSGDFPHEKHLFPGAELLEIRRSGNLVWIGAPQDFDDHAN